LVGYAPGTGCNQSAVLHKSNLANSETMNNFVYSTFILLLQESKEIIDVGIVPYKSINLYTRCFTTLIQEALVVSGVRLASLGVGA
jgi:hypothetical protein